MKTGNVLCWLFLELTMHKTWDVTKDGYASVHTTIKPIKAL